MSDYKNYLPSKKFQASILFIIVLIIIFFGIKGVISLFKNKKPSVREPVKVTIGEIIQKDSNGNGIADWEEYLWGLDPYKNGPENKEFILAKKKTLAENNDQLSADGSQTITDNEVLSQEFFAAIVSLQQTGSLNDESLGAITNAIGDNVKAVELKDVYTYNMMTVVNDSAIANSTYQNNLSKLVTKYKDADIGNELTFIIQGLNNKDPQALYAAKTVAIAYQNFGKEFIKVPVPKALASLQLNATNNYEKTGQTIHSLTTMLGDPLGGMKGILNYKKYNDALGADLEKISEILQ
jgi:hypothetical protein